MVRWGVQTCRQYAGEVNREWNTPEKNREPKQVGSFSTQESLVQPVSASPNLPRTGVESGVGDSIRKFEVGSDIHASGHSTRRTDVK